MCVCVCVCVPVGGDAAMATGADAPPGYSKVLKEQPAVLAYQGAFVQPVQYMVRVWMTASMLYDVYTAI